MKYVCLTHGIAVIDEGNLRKYETPPGSWAGVPPCVLLTMIELQKGTFGDCRVVKEEE